MYLYGFLFTRAWPKSPSLRRPEGDSYMLAGLTSMCTTCSEGMIMLVCDGQTQDCPNTGQHVCMLMCTCPCKHVYYCQVLFFRSRECLWKHQSFSRHMQVAAHPMLVHVSQACGHVCQNFDQFRLGERAALSPCPKQRAHAQLRLRIHFHV
jgi:hypothetical protein